MRIGCLCAPAVCGVRFFFPGQNKSKGACRYGRLPYWSEDGWLNRHFFARFSILRGLLLHLDHHKRIRFRGRIRVRMLRRRLWPRSKLHRVGVQPASAGHHRHRARARGALAGRHPVAGRRLGPDRGGSLVQVAVVAPRRVAGEHGDRDRLRGRRARLPLHLHHARDDDHRELEALGGMHGHHPDTSVI